MPTPRGLFSSLTASQALRMGDLVLARVMAYLYQGQSELTLRSKDIREGGAKVFQVDWSQGAPFPPDCSQEEVDRIVVLRDWRATLGSDVPWVTRGPSALDPRAIVRPPGSHAHPVISHVQDAQPAISHPPGAKPTTSRPPDGQPMTLGARSREIDAKMRRTLSSLEAPQFNFFDLALVRITHRQSASASSPFLLVMLHSSRDESAKCMPASCWGPEKVNQLSAAFAKGKGVAYAEIDNVRLIRDKHDQLEIKINEGSTLRFLDEDDPEVVSAMPPPPQPPAAPAQPPQPPKAMRPQGGQERKWKCSECTYANFQSRRNCMKCRKPFNDAIDLWQNPPPVLVAPNAPPPLASQDGERISHDLSHL
jgi:hypothetical protein